MALHGTSSLATTDSVVSPETKVSAAVGPQDDRREEWQEDR
jgi:hypothetical protein